MKTLYSQGLIIIGLSLLVMSWQAMAQDAAQKATVLDKAAVNAKPSPAPAQVPVSSSRVFTDLAFSKDYDAGTKDARGQLMAGTETMRLVEHGGMLFAGLDAWTDKPYGPRPADQPPYTGPQVVVKESAAAPWRVEISFPRGVRMETIVSTTFVTDGAGKKLEPPVRLLLASPSYRASTAVWTRDDATGKWAEMVVVDGANGGVRSFCTHVDSVTGVESLFGGASKNGGGGPPQGSIYRAVYDPAVAGKLRWQKEPELTGTGRVMCFTEADSVLYAACGILSDEPLSGGLFRRVDGEKPHWELLWRWPRLARDTGDETIIMRGLTAIPDPKGGRLKVLLGTCDYPGVVYRIDPNQNYAATTELDIRAYFAKSFGVDKLTGPCLSAYNNFLPATDPDTVEKVWLLGVWINHPQRRTYEKGSGAWYLVRHSDGTYGDGCVFDPKNPQPNPPRGLVALRTILASPFPEDKGRVFYFGGYDCASVDSHNTAWIYKGVLPAANAKN